MNPSSTLSYFKKPFLKKFGNKKVSKKPKIVEETQEIDNYEPGDSILDDLSGQSSLSNLKGDLETAVSHYLNQVKELGYYKESTNRESPCSFTTFKTPALPHRLKSRPAPDPPDSSLDVQFKLDPSDLVFDDEDSFTEDEFEEEEDIPSRGQEGLDNPLYLSLSECSTGPQDESIKEPLYENGSLVNSDDDHIYENVDIGFHLYDTVSNPPKPKLPPKPGQFDSLAKFNQSHSTDINEGGLITAINQDNLQSEETEVGNDTKYIKETDHSGKRRSSIELDGSETSDLGSSGSDITSEEDWPLPPTPPQTDNLAEELPLPPPPPEIALQQLEDEVLRAEEEAKKRSSNTEVKQNINEELKDEKYLKVKKVSKITKKSSSFSEVREKPFFLTIEEDSGNLRKEFTPLEEDPIVKRQLKKKISAINKGLSTYKEAIKKREYQTLPKTNSNTEQDSIITPAIRHSVIIELKDSCSVNQIALKPSEIKKKENIKKSPKNFCSKEANLIVKEVAGVCVNVKQDFQNLKSDIPNSKEIYKQLNEQIIEISDDGSWEMKDTNSNSETSDAVNGDQAAPDIDPFTGQPILNSKSAENDVSIIKLEDAKPDINGMENLKDSKKIHSNGSVYYDDSEMSNSCDSSPISESSENISEESTPSQSDKAHAENKDMGEITNSSKDENDNVCDIQNFDQNENPRNELIQLCQDDEESKNGGKNLGAAIMEGYEKDINRKKEMLNLPEVSMLEFGDSAKDMEIQRRTVIQQMTVKAKKKDSWIRDFRPPNSKETRRQVSSEQPEENEIIDKHESNDSHFKDPLVNTSNVQTEQVQQESSEHKDEEASPENKNFTVKNDTELKMSTSEITSLQVKETRRVQFAKETQQKSNSKKVQKEGFLGKCLRKERKSKAPDPPSVVIAADKPKEDTSENFKIETKGEIQLSGTPLKEKDQVASEENSKPKPKMLGTLDDGGWEPVANVMFQPEPGIIPESTREEDLAVHDSNVPPPPQFQADSELSFSSFSTQDSIKCSSINDVAAKKQYVYGSDEEIKPKKLAPTAITTTQLDIQIHSHENAIEAEIREQQIREEKLRQETALRNRDKTGGASSPSSHTSDEGFVDRPPEDIAPLITSTGSSSEGFTHTVTGNNGEPIIYDAISPVADIYAEKVEEPLVTHNSETKIALEIRELREREAELRAMRELRQQELEALNRCQDSSASQENEEEEEEGSTTRDLIDDHLTSLTTTTDEGNYSECGDPTSSEDKSSDGSNSRIMSPDPHCSPSAFVSASPSEMRQRRITVKPFEDLDESEDQPPIYTRMKKESVIEREIRLAKEREEAFRREKGLPSPSSEGIRVSHGTYKSTSMQSSSTSIILDTSKEKTIIEEAPRRSVKHLIASNFIQQEIQEASQRERELKSSGHIRTLSEDTVDCKVTRMSDLASAQNQKPRVSPVPPSPSPTPPANLNSPATPKTHTPHSSFTKKISPLSPGSPYVVPSFTPSPAQRPPAPTRLTRSLSTNNLSTTPFGISSSSTFRPKGLMQKFIASRGKMTAPTFANSATAHISPSYKASPCPTPSPVSNGIPTRPMKLQPKSPVVHKEIENKTQEEQSLTKIYKRTHTTAEEKIQEELREMKSREEELRRLRARNLARSQPNLAGLLIDEDEDRLNTEEDEAEGDPNVVNGVDSSSLHPQVNGMRAALSNPNLLDVETEAPAPAPAAPRRRSALIAQWEGRIQQTTET